MLKSANARLVVGQVAQVVVVMMRDIITSRAPRSQAQDDRSPILELSAEQVESRQARRRLVLLQVQALLLLDQLDNSIARGDGDGPMRAHLQ